MKGPLPSIKCLLKGHEPARFRLKQALLFWVLVLMASADLSAQVTSTFQGYISDPNGASVPEAKVTATNEETGVSRSAASAQDGYYRIPDLLAGTYRLTVERSGFKTNIRSGIVLNAKTVVGQNFALELGEITQSVTVRAEGAQVETQEARVNDVITRQDLESLPMLGRTPVSLVLSSPGITGKFESLGGQYCCDVFGVLKSPDFSSGGNEFKTNYTVDGLSFRYGDGAQWGLSFTPNPDSLEEVNVSTSAYTAEQGSMSGPQVQLVTKGGTNHWHGTGHYTFRQSDLNAVPFRSTRTDVPDSNYKLFGGTLGGPIIKDRLFGFFAYEGRRARSASSSVELAETEQFKNWVVGTRPNSVAAQLLKDFPPLRYPTEGLSDLNGDGVPDIGEVVVNTPFKQGGRQFNGRIDYHFPNTKDRIYGSYWYTRPSQTGSNLRDAFARDISTAVNYVNFAHSHVFSPNVLNEIRFGNSDTSVVDKTTSGAYHVPGIFTDDGLSMGNFSWALDVWQTRVTELGDTVSINRGKHGIKLGGGYVEREVAFQSLINNDTPQYGFASIFDFADDKPYFEVRTLDVASGKANKTDQTQGQKELFFFVQNSLQVRPNITLNYGLRWEYFSAPWLRARGKETWQPVLDSNQLTPSAISQVINQKVEHFARRDLNNFGPRVSVAWDPSGKGKTSIHASFGMLYDEINALQHYNIAVNPPGTADVQAGTDVGIPVVYGLAPVGTRDFPANRFLQVPKLTPQGGFEGTTVGLAAYANNVKSPLVYDSLVGVQYQLFGNVMVFGDYRYRRNTNDMYADDLNRFEGDMVDGRLDRLNPHFNEINMLYNAGKRIYHGLVFGASKRFSRGWSVDAHYTYNHGKNNFGQVGQFADSGSTSPYNPDVDRARDDIPRVFTFRNVWELPVFRTRTDWVGKVFGGWQLNSIWNLQSGGIFTPRSSRRFGQGGDFNGDGRNNDRPDRPAADVPRSFSKSEWLNGALRADIFPLPDPSQPRVGTLPRDYFRGPGYARIDIGAGKSFRLTETAKLAFRADAFNALNRINLAGVQRTINNSNFGRATSAYLMRVLQFSIKFTF
ncbi:MAG: carboxypeptidase regulatory-like domain-containing protein [Acidobacteria bacterium]|nr:carboxypeptidase regulatory-like domain-containing protein [Acidobacteriota bacterium]